MVARRLFLPILAIVMSAAACRAEDLLVIANASVTLGQPLPLPQIAAFYLLRQSRWPDGSRVIPVNREASSQIRVRFTAAVLRQDPDSLARYWDVMHYQGKQPPIVQESEQAVLAFVQNVPGAVGYVAPQILPANVRLLARIADPGGAK